MGLGGEHRRPAGGRPGPQGAIARPNRHSHCPPPPPLPPLPPIPQLYADLPGPCLRLGPRPIHHLHSIGSLPPHTPHPAVRRPVSVAGPRKQ